jgi:hypothetical protein
MIVKVQGGAVYGRGCERILQEMLVTACPGMLLNSLR